MKTSDKLVQKWTLGVAELIRDLLRHYQDEYEELLPKKLTARGIKLMDGIISEIGGTDGDQS